MAILLTCVLGYSPSGLTSWFKSTAESHTENRNHDIIWSVKLCCVTGLATAYKSAPTKYATPNSLHALSLYSQAKPANKPSIWCGTRLTSTQYWPHQDYFFHGERDGDLRFQQGHHGTTQDETHPMFSYFMAPIMSAIILFGRTFNLIIDCERRRWMVRVDMG